MKQIRIAVLLLSLLIALLERPSMAAESKTQDRPSGVKVEVTSITATVTEINYKYRTVVLKGPKGDLVEMQVGDEARNFDQVKVGDLVTIENSKSVALEVRKATGEPVAMETKSITRAKPGQKPSGTVKTIGLMTVRVEDIDYKTREATLKMADGNTMKIEVGPQVKRLEEVHKGDEVVVRYTTMVSISVKKP
jgi:ribosomal 50S subunit-recycling heat shock protein